jgi:hypothetical protein
VAADAKRWSGWFAGACATLLLVPTAGAATFQFGSALQRAPNISPGCESMPFPDTMSDGYVTMASNTADCTWFQDPIVGAPASDPRTGNVPGDGTITQVDVRSGPNPSPLRFVVFSYQDADFGRAPVCCFFQAETQPVQPQPNAVTTFQLNLPVQHNVTSSGFARFDVMGVSAAAGAGTLPLAATAPPSQAAQFQVGTQDASFFYPRMGFFPNDSAGGRPASGIISNVEVTVRWTWQSAPAAPGGGGGGGGAPAPGPVVRLAPTVASQLARIKRNVAQIPLTCAQNTTSCQGALDLLALNGGTANKQKARAPVSYGHATYSIPAHRTATIKVPLTKAAKKKLRSRRRLSAVLRLSPAGGVPTSSPLKLKR